MFERIGRKLVKGAKAEIDSISTVDGERALHILLGILNGGILLLSLFAGGRSEKGAPTTVIVNNYICSKEEH